MTPAVRMRTNQLLVKRRAPAETTKGGIVLPEQHRTRVKPCEGDVLLVGPDATETVPGNVVVFAEFAGHEIQLQLPDETVDLFLIMPEDDVLLYHASEQTIPTQELEAVKKAFRESGEPQD